MALLEPPTHTAPKFQSLQVVLKIDVLVFHATPQPLNELVVYPSSLSIHAHRRALRFHWFAVASTRSDFTAVSLDCWDQFLAMACAQITYRKSLSDLDICLRSRRDQLYQIGLRSSIPRSSLADANRVRDWRTYADLVQGLIFRARRLYADEALGADLDL